MVKQLQKRREYQARRPLRLLQLVDAEPLLRYPYGTLQFLCMRGGGILERCYEAAEFKPLYHVQFFRFFLSQC